MSTGEDRVENVTRECEIKCRQFPDYHCSDTCKRAPLGERYDGEFAHSMYLLRKKLGMLTMLERWGLGFLQCPLGLLDESVSSLCKTWPRSRAPLWKRLMYPLAGASLFFILSIAIFYVRRRTEAARRFAEAQEPKGPPPASAATLANLPVRPARAGELSGENSTCCVCLEALREGDSVAKLPCGHVYHAACVKNWLIKHCTCPNCRYELPTDDASFERMPHPGTPEMIRSGLLWGGLFCGFVAGVFLGMAAFSLLKYVAGEANSEESATAGL